MNFVIFAVVAVVAVALVALTIEAKQKRRAALGKVAERLHLECEGETISGVLDGIPLSVRTQFRGFGRHRRLYTVFRFQLTTNLPEDLSIVFETTGKKLLTVMGAQDIELGLHEFDPKLTVKGRNEEEVRAWARRSGVIEGLSRLLEMRNCGFKIKKGWLTVDLLGLEHQKKKASFIEDLIYQLVSIVSCMSADHVETSQILKID